MDQTASQRLIETKLQPPNLTRNNIPRAAVLDALSGAAHVSAYLVAAPGSGKSTIMRQIYDACALNDVRLGWLSLDGRDKTPSQFLGYFCEMLSRAGVIDQQDVFQQTGLTNAEDIDLAFSLINQAAARVSFPTAVFLDDFQALQDVQILAGLSGFLDAKSENLRVFIAARAQPELQMQKRVMTGSFIRLDHESLNFQKSEAEAFFKKSMSENITPEDIEHLLQSTEGWAAGLQIASISRKTAAGQLPLIPSEFSGASNQVVQYLSDNVFQTLPDDIQDFLLATAPLNRFCSDLCRHIRGRKGNAAALEWLLDHNLFLVALDNSGTWFRYHHMFAEFLMHTARKTRHHPREDICQRASDWCRNNGLMDEAVDYLLTIGDHPNAAQLIAELSPQLARQKGDTVTLIRWIESLPEAERQLYPAMMLDYAFSLSFSLDTERALDIVRDVRTHFAAPGDASPARKDTLAYADTVEALTFAARDACNEALRLIGKARQDWAGADTGILGILSNIAAYCHMTKNQSGPAAREVVDARMSGLRSGSGYVSIWADCIDSMALCRAGDLEGAKEPLNRALLEISKERDSDLLLLLVQLLAANRAYLSGDIASAQAHFAAGAGFSASFGPVEPLIISHTIRAWIAAQSGASETALKFVENGIGLGLRRGLPRLAFSLIGQKISLLSLQNEKRAALGFAERWGVLNGTWKSRFGPDADALDHIHKRILAELAIVEGRHAEAVRILSHMERIKGHRAPLADGIRLKLLKAHALAQAQDEDAALRDLGKAAQLAIDSGVIAPFIEYQLYAVPLLQETLRRRRDVDTPIGLIASSAEAQVLARLVPDNGPSPHAQESDPPMIPDPLTDREAELLRLAESGMTNAQIAAHLIISQATVKWHLHNAFQKLGAKNRTSALLVARKFDLL